MSSSNIVDEMLRDPTLTERFDLVKSLTNDFHMEHFFAIAVLYQTSEEHVSDDHQINLEIAEQFDHAAKEELVEFIEAVFINR